jgi:GNAT superfamily N-acetyltransferase
MDGIKIGVEAAMQPADMGLIVRRLTEYNASQAAGETPNYLTVAARDAEGNIAGGLVGATWLGWLVVHALWVDDALRGQGHGGALLRAAEQEAVRRGCPRVFLETLSFQALPFYEKLGYAVFSRLDGFPPGGARYALTKMLDA